MRWLDLSRGASTASIEGEIRMSFVRLHGLPHQLVQVRGEPIPADRFAGLGLCPVWEGTDRRAYSLVLPRDVVVTQVPR